MKQEAIEIGRRDEGVQAYLVENAENDLTVRAEWINRNEKIVLAMWRFSP